MRVKQMVTMRKAQLSFEFILLFTILLFFFVSVAYLMLISGGLEESSSTKKITENLAKEVKVRFITASLSVSDFNSGMVIPGNINGVRLDVTFHEHPDNIIQIKDSESGELIAKAFLPIVDQVIDPVVVGTTGPVTNISIIKTADNKLKVYVERE
jgi:hypothetical protein